MTIPLTGPEAIQHALNSLNLEELEAEQRKVIADKKKTARPRAVRVLNILEGMKKNEVKPGDFMIKQVPVIPPKFRPFSVTGNTFLPGDANELYRDVVEYRRLYDRTASTLGKDGAGEVYMDMVQAVKAAYGYGDSPNPKTKARAVKGFFETVVGTNPKSSMYQSRMLSKPVDTVGRGVIIPDADFNMNEVGIPADMAWKLYGNYVQRRLVQGGMTAPSALRHVKERTPQATKALEAEMPSRPVVLTRSPAWHKANVIGQIPRIVQGDAIKTNTFVAEGLGGDYNGDCQIGKVVVLTSVDFVFNNRLYDLQTQVDVEMIDAMISRNIVPSFDHTTHKLRLIDLEHFPKGKLAGVNKNGKNGEIHFFEVPEGTKVVAYDEQSGLPVWSDVAFYSVHPDRTIEVVQLSNGRQIITDDDPRAVYAIDPESGDFALRRFTPTEALARKAVVPCVKDIAEACAGLDSLTHVTIGSKSVDLTWDFGYLLGAIAGDGWWDKKEYGGVRSLYLADLHGHNATKLHQCLTDVFGEVLWYRTDSPKREGDDRYGSSVKHTFRISDRQAAEDFCEFLTEWMGGASTDETSGSGNKFLPDFFLLAPRSFREGLVAGVVDTDGTCSVSNAKGKPQLMCAVTSTSMRLVSDLKFLCLTLGVRASVSFSKTTSRDNTSWVCTISAPDAKRADLFSKLSCPWKREAFINTPVSQENTSLIYDKVVVPRHVWERVARDLPSPKIKTSERRERDAGTAVEGLEARQEAQRFYQHWLTARDTGVVSRPLAFRLRELFEKRDADRAKALSEVITELRDSNLTEVTPEMGKRWVDVARSLLPPEAVDRQTGSGVKLWRNAKAARSARKIGARRKASLLRQFEEAEAYQNALHSEEFKTWMSSIVEVSAVAWSAVVDVHYTGQKETGYDLTVPGYETFMSVDGVILSNTVSIHVPSSKEAVADVKEKLMADKMVWSIKDRTKTLANPKHEQIIGLAMGRDAGGQKRKFASEAEAMKAIEEGRVDLNDDIEIG